MTPLFNKIYSGDAPNVVHTVAAVVDGISTPQKNNSGKHTSRAEGLSLLLADSSCVTASVTSPSLVKSSHLEEPLFFLGTKTTSTNPNNEISFQSSLEIGLRLAQTVFLNGRDRTLLGMRWSRNGPSETFNLDECRELSTCSVTSVASEARCSISVPVHPVTSRRQVISSMGNILRQVSKSPVGEGDSKTGIPASSELERELPRYVNELGIPHHRVAVWALVEPARTASSTKGNSQHDFHKSILSGSKIHRVVSGGGGWGKKQGLLSLDPETDFGEQHPMSLSVPLNQLFRTQSTNSDVPDMAALRDVLEGKGLEENMASLSQVASPGDYIQFFVASEPEATGGEATRGVDNQTVSPTTPSYSFGVRSPVETEGAASSITTSAPSPADITVIPDHFGAISESSISYSQEDASDALSRASKCGTKISVPGSRVELAITW